LGDCPERGQEGNSEEAELMIVVEESTRRKELKGLARSLLGCPEGEVGELLARANACVTPRLEDAENAHWVLASIAEVASECHEAQFPLIAAAFDAIP
jgi:hypothetical protein